MHRGSLRLRQPRSGSDMERNQTEVQQLGQNHSSEDAATEGRFCTAEGMTFVGKSNHGKPENCEEKEHEGVM